MIRNVFVLSAGRSGSRAFAAACEQMGNGWSVGHETRVHEMGPARFDYPRRHIEVDCRLVWKLGDLLDRYPEAHYVHLIRDREAAARSWSAAHRPFLKFWWRCVLLRWFERSIPEGQRLAVAQDMVDTANANLRLLARLGVSYQVIPLERPRAELSSLWRRLRASGDLDVALHELATSHRRQRVEARARRIERRRAHEAQKAAG